MEKINIKGIEISRLSLGTVQLGLSYGINNTVGKPSQERSNKILSCAMDNGINVLDTAGGYGDSEEVIGRWLKTIPKQKRPFIVTKARDLDHSSYENLRADLFNRVKSSKEKLGVDTLDMLMLHLFDEYLQDKENVMRVMRELKASGEVKYIGASAYSYHDYETLAQAGFDATQIPINIFDWGQIVNGGIKKLADSGMMVFVRSVYLQGLVFQKPENLSPKMDFCKEPLEKFHALCRKYNFSPAQMAMSFVLSLEGIHSLVLGSETVEQVEENTRLVNSTVRFDKAQMDEIRELFEDVDKRVINPSVWNK